METRFTVHLVLNLLIGTKAINSCEKSIPTLAYVKECPKTEEEWFAAAKRKQCDVVEQSCSTADNFQYHCVINPYANATVEVCAPVRNIIGHCAEYNYGRKSIQDHQNFKYQECYDIVTKQSEEIFNSTTESAGPIQRQDVQNISGYNYVLVLTIFNTVLIVIMTLFMTIVGIRKIMKSFTGVSSTGTYNLLEESDAADHPMSILPSSFSSVRL
ncbi:uncharacterized protein LOC134264392 [Saccostrea cucullata]|uniref:uncharacterized protein LOC134238503 n=1 Tax=Saccostrea cuccullata TaxID=36930 RepID=UPI002ECFB382